MSKALYKEQIGLKGRCYSYRMAATSFKLSWPNDLTCCTFSNFINSCLGGGGVEAQVKV